MDTHSSKRAAVVLSLLPTKCERLMDVGCGPITPDYPYSRQASQVVCIDWNPRIIGTPPDNVQPIAGDFAALGIPAGQFDAIIAADVFEHIQLEQEHAFISQCRMALKPGGSVIVSVPHKGRFAALDPYQVKPALHRLLYKLGLYDRVHNGFCDIRKGHRHYTVPELKRKFAPLRLEKTIFFGYLMDPLLSWANALRLYQTPCYPYLVNACSKEFSRDYGELSFNVAVRFRKETAIAPCPSPSSIRDPAGSFA